MKLLMTSNSYLGQFIMTGAILRSVISCQPKS